MVIEFMASDLNAQELTTRSKSGESITIDRIELMPNMPATLKCGIGKSLKCEN